MTKLNKTFSVLALTFSVAALSSCGQKNEGVEVFKCITNRGEALKVEDETRSMKVIQDGANYLVDVKIKGKSTKTNFISVNNEDCMAIKV